MKITKAENGNGQVMHSESYGDTVEVAYLPQGGLSLALMRNDVADDRTRIVLDNEQATLIASMLQIDDAKAAKAVAEAIKGAMPPPPPPPLRREVLPSESPTMQTAGLILVAMVFSMGVLVGALIW